MFDFFKAAASKCNSCTRQDILRCANKNKCASTEKIAKMGEAFRTRPAAEAKKPVIVDTSFRIQRRSADMATKPSSNNRAIEDIFRGDSRGLAVCQVRRRGGYALAARNRARERVFSEPRFLMTFVSATVAWIVSDLALQRRGYRYFVEPPFFRRSKALLRSSAY